jgi:hypothetical protein
MKIRIKESNEELMNIRFTFIELIPPDLYRSGG